jgi:hypothetical protein
VFVVIDDACNVSDAMCYLNRKLRSELITLCHPLPESLERFFSVTKMLLCLLFLKDGQRLNTVLFISRLHVLVWVVFPISELHFLLWACPCRLANKGSRKEKRVLSWQNCYG